MNYGILMGIGYSSIGFVKGAMDSNGISIGDLDRLVIALVPLAAAISYPKLAKHWYLFS